MNINTLQAVTGYGTLPTAPSNSATDTVAQAAEEFMATLRAGEVQGAAAVTGNGDPHALVMALTQSKLAVETTVAVRDKVVEAYQELLRMPV